MASAVYDFIGENSIQKGATFAKTLVWKDAAGSLVNLTGLTARMHIRPSVSSSTVLANLTTANGGIVLGGALGTIALLLTATQTAAIAAKSGVYDIELVAADGTVTRLIEGAVDFTPEVTR